MAALNILVVHKNTESVKAALKHIDWASLDMHAATFVSSCDAALTLIRQQKYSIVLADIDARSTEGNFIAVTAQRHPDILFIAIAPDTASKNLVRLMRLENVYDYVNPTLNPAELSKTLDRAHHYYEKMMLAMAAVQLMDLSAFDVPSALQKNVRSSLRAILKDASDSNLNDLAQDVSVLFQEILNPYRIGDIAFSRATAVELISQLRYLLFSQNLNADGELSPAIFIRKIQAAYTNDDLEDLCLYYLRLGMQLMNPNTSNSQMSALVRTAIKITRKRYSDSSFTLVSLSDEIGISPNYLSSVFKMETGIRFKKYLNSYRIEQAKVLLQDSRYKIYEIANLVGIEDSRYFSQIFRTYTGLKPSEFRNICTGDSSEESS